MDMTKFEDIGEPGFVGVAGEIRRWVKEVARAGKSGRAQPRTRSSENRTLNEEEGASYPERHVLSITQEGSAHSGPTTVSGGSVFQGNYIGREGGFFR